MSDATFGDFLKRKSYEWKGKELRRTGKEPSQNQFALYLGVSNSMLSLWVNNQRMPHGKVLDQIADKLGVETYDAAGVARRMPRNKKLALLAAIWDRLTEEDQDKLYEQARTIAEKEDDTTTRTAA